MSRPRLASLSLLLAVLQPPCLRAAPERAPASRMVDVASASPGIRLEMRYATADNFMKRAVYPCARCLLAEDAAKALGRVESAVEAKGLHLKLWDCYRPRAVQERMWAIVHDTRYVADPSKGSNHERGGAVDLTLVDEHGTELEMPTAHDDFTVAARADAPASAAAITERGWPPRATSRRRRRGDAESLPCRAE